MIIEIDTEEKVIRVDETKVNLAEFFNFLTQMRISLAEYSLDTRAKAGLKDSSEWARPLDLNPGRGLPPWNPSRDSGYPGQNDIWYSTGTGQRNEDC